MKFLFSILALAVTNTVTSTTAVSSSSSHRRHLRHNNNGKKSSSAPGKHGKKGYSSTPAPTSEPDFSLGGDSNTESYRNLQLCAKPYESSNEGDNYFWLVLNDSQNKVVKGQCLVTFPHQGSDATQCCTINQGTSTEIDWTNDELLVQDPLTMTDNEICGAHSKSSCPNLNKHHDNLMSFTSFHLLDKDDTMIKKVTDFSGIIGSCGLHNQNGQCNVQLPRYGRITVGNGECMEAAVSMKKACNEETSYYECHNCRKFYKNMKLCGNLAANVANNKYFWMAVADPSKNSQPVAEDIKGTCLLELNPGATYEQCCTVPGYTEYSKGFQFVITDPHGMHVEPYTSMCGSTNTTESCPDYDYSLNTQFFGYFQLQDENGDGIRKLDTFIQGSHGGCGTANPYSQGKTCKDDIAFAGAPGKSIWRDIRIGENHCVMGGIDLKPFCDGYFKFDCLHANCD